MRSLVYAVIAVSSRQTVVQQYGTETFTIISIISNIFIKNNNYCPGSLRYPRAKSKKNVKTTGMTRSLVRR